MGAWACQRYLSVAGGEQRGGGFAGGGAIVRGGGFPMGVLYDYQARFTVDYNQTYTSVVSLEIWNGPNHLYDEHTVAANSFLVIDLEESGQVTFRLNELVGRGAVWTWIPPVSRQFMGIPTRYSILIRFPSDSYEYSLEQID